MGTSCSYKEELLCCAEADGSDKNNIKRMSVIYEARMRKTVIYKILRTNIVWSQKISLLGRGVQKQKFPREGQGT